MDSQTLSTGLDKENIFATINPQRTKNSRLKILGHVWYIPNHQPDTSLCKRYLLQCSVIINITTEI